MEQREFIELIRLAYLAGINDCQNDCEQWCSEGSNERAHELTQEFIDSGEMTHEF
jgi:hypothetical protein